MRQRLTSWKLTLFILFAVCINGEVAYAADLYLSRRLGVSQSTLQKSLEKVGGPVTFTPRPGSTQGTQEARLPEHAGIVQAGGGSENLAVVILWLPVDQQGRLSGAKAQSYLDALVRNFTAESEQVVLWIDQVLRRAVAETRGGPHLESQLFGRYQFKATYAPSLSPPMISLTVTAAEEQGGILPNTVPYCWPVERVRALTGEDIRPVGETDLPLHSWRRAHSA